MGIFSILTIIIAGALGIVVFGSIIWVVMQLQKDIGIPLIAKDLALSEVYELLGEPVKNAWQYLVFLKDREGRVRAYALSSVPPPVFQVVVNDQGEKQFIAFPRERPPSAEAATELIEK